jgi:hypothetical protein
LIICSLNIAFAQKEQLEWIFGSSGVGLRFDPNDYSTTVTMNNFTPYTREGCSVVSNPVNGALMFYTDGISAVDSQHRLMPNGAKLFWSFPKIHGQHVHRTATIECVMWAFVVIIIHPFISEYSYLT